MEQQHGLRRHIVPLQIAILVAISFGVGVLFGSEYSVTQAQGNTTLNAEAQEAFAPLYETYNLIKQQFIEKVPDSMLVDAAIGGMVEGLEDQYSAYADPEAFAYMNDELSGQIEGIGAVIEQNDDGLIEIANVLPNTPAERAGVRVGDVFLVVDGADVTTLNTFELVGLVRGPSGSTVEITFRRGEEELTLAIVRAPIEIPNVEYEILEGGIAYLQLSNFTSIARGQLDEAMTALRQENVNGLIFDLRDNPGGFLSTATEVAGLFLKDGTILIEEFGDESEHVFKINNGQVLLIADGNQQVYSSNAAYAELDVPIVVLVNERSASASELVAGAWQDAGVVTVLGEVSFGKGSVQIQNSLSNGGGLRLTVARWLTPNGNSISEVGITPDIVVPFDETEATDIDPQLEAAIQFLLTGEIPPQPEATEAVPGE